jgi:cytochrome c biogenesis protein CcmG/thiol:disulfide interchange protein DsbE
MRSVNRAWWWMPKFNFVFLTLISLSVQAKVRVNDPFPKFDLVGIGRSERVTSQSIDGKVALIDLWASWCEPCKESFPFFNEMQKKYAAQGFVVVGVNVDESQQDIPNFLKSTPAEFTLAYDEGRKLIGQLKVGTMPTFYLVNGQGRVLEIHKGFTQADKSEIESMITRSLAAAHGKTGKTARY